MAWLRCGRRPTRKLHIHETGTQFNDHYYHGDNQVYYTWEDISLGCINVAVTRNQDHSRASHLKISPNILKVSSEPEGCGYQGQK
jgi:hypothetical protein